MRSSLSLFLSFGWALADYVGPVPLYPCPKDTLQFHPCVCLKGTDVGLTVFCENTNLAALSVGISNIISLRAPIEELKISSSNIRYLFGDIFYSLNARRIFVIDTPIHAIHEDVFLGVAKYLKELYLFRTNISAFPTSAFNKLENLNVLAIDGHFMKVLDANIIWSGNGNLERLSIVNGSISSLTASVFESFRKLKYLNLSGNQILKLQKNQFKGLKELEALDLSYNYISQLDSSHFSDLPKLAHCNLSHNAISLLPKNAFARNNVLKVLNLGGNQITKIDGNMFRGMRLLRRLTLNDNQINYIERGTFATISHIGFIHLRNNSLTKIGYQSFAGLRYLEEVDLSCNAITLVEKLAFEGLYLAKINISHNLISVIESGAFENCVNMTTLDLSHNDIKEFVKKALDEFSYATTLLLSYNKFTDLSQVPLANMTGLKTLNASHNLIERIPRGTFPKLYELHTIDLSFNKLEKIAPESFQSLFSLRYLNLSYNRMREIDRRTIGTVATLLELDLSANNIDRVDKDAFTRLSSLQTLNLFDNALEQWFWIPQSLFYLNMAQNYIGDMEPGKVWPIANALILLDLSSNRIGDALRGSSFLNLRTLQSVDLSFNRMTVPPIDAFRDLSSLRYIRMTGNNLTTLGESSFGLLPVVFDLDLSKNQISEISANAFVGLLQLRALNLSGNFIERISNGAFKDMVSLEVLDLSFNNVSTLENDTQSILDGCLSLKWLNASHNQISFVANRTFPSNSVLQNLDVSYNQIATLPWQMSQNLKKLLHLNISRNSVNEIAGGLMENLVSLKSLDVSFNELSSFSTSRRFTFPKNLTHLRMEWNQFRIFPAEAISNRSMELIDARQNFLSTFPDALFELIKNGTKVLYNDNPITCGCHLRPLRRWLASQLIVPGEWRNFTCVNYDSQRRQILTDIADEDEHERLFCDDPNYQPYPDVQFRYITALKDGAVSISWFIVNNKADIGGFLLEVTDDSGKSVRTKTLPYFARVDTSQFYSRCQNCSVCIRIKDSLGILKEGNRTNPCMRLSLVSASTNHGFSLATFALCFTFLWYVAINAI